MKWEQADANREARKAEVRATLQEWGLIEVVDALRSVFGDGVRLEWATDGKSILGKEAYEKSVLEAKARKRRVARWHLVRKKWLGESQRWRESASEPRIADYAGRSLKRRSKRKGGYARRGSGKGGGRSS